MEKEGIVIGQKGNSTPRSGGQGGGVVSWIVGTRRLIGAGSRDVRRSKLLSRFLSERQSVNRVSFVTGVRPPLLGCSLKGPGSFRSVVSGPDPSPPLNESESPGASDVGPFGRGVVTDLCVGAPWEREGTRSVPRWLCRSRVWALTRTGQVWTGCEGVRSLVV